MSTLYGYDLFTGTSGTALTSHTPDSGGSWPSDSNHEQTFSSGSSPLLDGNGYIYNGVGGVVNSTSWTMPSTQNFEIYFDYVRKSALSGAQVEVNLLDTQPANSFAMGLLFNETNISWQLNTSTQGSVYTPIPSVNTVWRVRLRCTVSGGNTLFQAAYSTNGGNTYTSLGIDQTVATPAAAINGVIYFYNGGSASTPTTGPHVGRFVLQDLSATTATLSGGSSTGTAGTQISTPFTVTLDKAAGYGGVVITPAGTLSGDTFQATLGGGNVSTVTIAQGSSTGNFYLTPGAAGTDSVSITTAPVLSYSGSPIAVTVSASSLATTYTLTGPSTGHQTQSTGNFTVTPDGTATGTITLTPSGAAASGLSAVVLTFAGTSTPQTAAWTPTATGTLTITGTNTCGISNPAAVNDTISAITYTLTGPTTGYQTQSTGNFTVTPNSAYTGTITLTPSGAAAAGLTASVLTFTSSAVAQTAAWTPTATGTLTITPTNSASLSNPSAINDTISAITYTLTGPTTGYAGSSTGNFTVTPSSPYTGTITLTPSGAAASGLSAVVKTFSSSATPQTAAWTPTATGTLTITPTNSASLSNPSAINDTISAALSTSTIIPVVGGLVPGQAVGYTIYNSSLVITHARSTSGVVEQGFGIYQATITTITAADALIVWDDTLGHCVFQTV